MAVIRKYTKEVIVGGSGGMVPHKISMLCMRWLLVASETASTNNSSEHAFSSAKGLL